MKLRPLDYLTDIEERIDRNFASIATKLKCSCGSTKFNYYHTGKQTKGILSPFIVKKDGQLQIKAICPVCQNTIELYNSNQDGVNFEPTNASTEFQQFVANKITNPFSVVLKYNYYTDNLKNEDGYTNQFENCFIYIVDEKGKEKALIEE